MLPHALLVASACLEAYEHLISTCHLIGIFYKKKTGRQSWSALFSEVKGLNAGAAVGLALLLARRKR